MARGVDQLSQATRARVRGPTGSTRYHGRFTLHSEVLRSRPAPPGNAGAGPRARVVDQLSRTTRAMVGVPSGQPAVPVVSGPFRTYCGVDHASRLTRAHARGPSVWTSSPGQVGTVPGASWGRPDFPGASGPCRRACGVEQLSRATRDQVRGCLLYTSPSPRDGLLSRMPSSA